MESIPTNLFELGATAVVSVIAILALVNVIKAKKQQSNGTMDKRILEQLQILNENHLETLSKCINENNRNLVDTIHDDNKTIIELLGEIKGLLSR